MITSRTNYCGSVYWSDSDTNDSDDLVSQESWLGNWVLVIVKYVHSGHSATLKKCLITYLVTASRKHKGLWGLPLQDVDLGAIESLIRNKKIVHPIAPVVGTHGSSTSLPVRSTWDLQELCIT